MKRNYPCILDSGAYTWLAYDHENGVALNDNLEKYKGSVSFNSDTFKNITSDYLRNTKVKVESEEHSEFLQYLVFSIGGSWRSGSKQIKNLDAEWHLIDDELLISNSYQKDYNKESMRLITLPLPPKGEIKHDPQTVGTAAIATLSIMGYKYHGSGLWKPPLGDTLKESEDFPQVGDEAAWGCLTNKCTVISLHDCHAWIKDKDGELETININQLMKPPTPEEELAEKLDEAALATIEIDDLIKLSKAIINGEIKGLSYKPE